MAQRERARPRGTSTPATGQTLTSVLTTQSKSKCLTNNNLCPCRPQAAHGPSDASGAFTAAPLSAAQRRRCPGHPLHAGHPHVDLRP